MYQLLIMAIIFFLHARTQTCYYNVTKLRKISDYAFITQRNPRVLDLTVLFQTALNVSQ